MHPATIMTALPLAIVGAILALFLRGDSVSMGAMIGIILLMGLVTKNGILLVDHAVAKVREEGWTPYEAILDAGPLAPSPHPHDERRDGARNAPHRIEQWLWLGVPWSLWPPASIGGRHQLDDSHPGSSCPSSS